MTDLKLVPKRTEDDGLPKGVNRNYSPLWHFSQHPYTLLNPLLRYAQVRHAVETIIQMDHLATPRILDIGCGMGEMARFLEGSNYGFTYVGYDIDPWKLSIAKTMFETCGNVTFFEQDLTEDFAFWRSDIAICQEVLEHIDKQDGLHILDRLSHTTKYLVLTVPKPHYHRDEPSHINEMTTTEIKIMLEDTHFEIQYVGGLYAEVKRLPYSCTKLRQQTSGMLNYGDAEGCDVTFIVAKVRENA